ncbi:hypothetical protein E3Q22_02258 [Wallemia mellicola]|uniref:Uncharacterized protein n=2 Tax=Wallemia mellicola TaxID=1708541 RepID=A0A4T0M488_9BASI|nr:hypothetical protein WALSEDRAFT_70009 [Wallemia mellicola CBS 633.66]TIB77531.1 hypothetical protein E3Q23_01250 [Wallemia mellicola]EIM20251.1 hypothetical protein WALSEDRAFT_70009 [Wallemia mellicola CBS 633.66]TIB79890.1 hypothetical protein E3Q22_02258 [Wallemia mellicola]TIB86884.1 hypothetical protein E3Q21_01504 [Wallemia mellicola]TIB89809.1 hypothetical protein E3Q20_01518 [Wallemia mellicola]|eukprot:XP_006959739.1 hypothetical protein WALSEDRAFT_70009 [Wallemia mellicola CBS 633.66]
MVLKMYKPVDYSSKSVPDNGNNEYFDESSKPWQCMMCGRNNVFTARYCANPTCSFDRNWGS